ncbi:MAG: glycosyltransferase involved in cell wall biosynthesis [Candidatus Marinamargulisbacteria bacterium]|jgi:glycosyltransferase involved in cell wall biosynthesis
MSEPVISVVIGTYNQADVLMRVLKALNEQTLSPQQYEVVVVDSMSDDGTESLVSAHEPKHHFQYIREANKGKAYARNFGVRKANGKFVVITDADMIADERFIETHLAAQESSSEPTCFEGLTYNLDYLHWPPKSDAIAPYISANYEPGKKLGWFYFLTGNLSFPKSLFILESGFSEAFDGYGWEDLELGYRLSKKKVPLFYLKAAVNYHYHVITKQEEIERCYNKGISAKTFLSLHPELKWFLGLNPLSVSIFKRLAPEGAVHRLFRDRIFVSKKPALRGFGFWFLKEFQYLRGILRTE